MGPTGCGKSTILNTVTGLFKHSSETFRSSASRSRDSMIGPATCSNRRA
ncbi:MULTISPECIES: hypothetical protein [Bradyrhizobium]|nr:MULTISPECIES: hypothetical protein [Bradyrhizobium]